MDEEIAYHFPNNRQARLNTMPLTTIRKTDEKITVSLDILSDYERLNSGNGTIMNAVWEIS